MDLAELQKRAAEALHKAGLPFEAVLTVYIALEEQHTEISAIGIPDATERNYGQRWARWYIDNVAEGYVDTMN